MFKGKVVIYKNINGKEQHISKEFDNPQDYEYFIKNSPVKEIQHLEQSIKFPQRNEFTDYMENLFDSKFVSHLSDAFGKISSQAEKATPMLVKASTPTKKQATPAKKTAPVAKKPIAKKIVSKASPKKPVKVVAKKAPAKKVAPKMIAKKAPVKKVMAKKVVAKKPVAKKKK
ncbi:MAG TPA: hypothetical protein PKD96_03905 [Candidatus Absconditabacterales bacterium]|nr:hypothetical protein [Candidatus Absconditabacterales bacterium]